MTLASTATLPDELLSNDEYRKLHEDHVDTKERLKAIQEKTLLSEEDEVEIRRMKLHKLALKDQMEVIRRLHATG